MECRFFDLHFGVESVGSAYPGAQVRQQPRLGAEAA
jgi:hypothetical protein